MPRTRPRRKQPLCTLRQLRPSDLAGRRVLVRIDINIETSGQKARDTSRMEAVKPTIDFLVQHQARVILIAHRGRPEHREPSLSLRPLVPDLRSVFRRPVRFISTPIWDDKIKNELASIPTGHVALLENIRYESGESTNDSRLAGRLATFGDLVVNDAFADSHRAHASIAGLSRFLPVFAGFGLVKEIEQLTRALSRPRHPYVAVIGGAKISTKLGLVRELLKTADAVLLGGALANTVLKAEGVAIGASLIEPKMIVAARGLHTTNTKLHIPVDVLVTGRGKKGAVQRAIGNVGPREKILDIGPDTVDVFTRVLRTARTVVWNGPMGVYEQPPFDRGTRAMARAIGRLSATTVAGGGETEDAIRRQHLEKRFTVLSTGGGAMLEWLEGKELPGIVACMKGNSV